MLSEVAQLKEALRGRVRRRLAAMAAAERAQASAAVCARLRQHAVWRRSAWVLFYAPKAPELDCWPLLVERVRGGLGAALLRHRVDGAGYEACAVLDVERDVMAGRFGIREPGPGCRVVPLMELDLVLVPGVVFAKDGLRIGRGKGHYDRLLPGVRGGKCGLAFDQQIEAGIPRELHDVSLDYLVTPTGWFECGSLPGI